MAMHTELWFPTVIWSSIIHTGDNRELKAFAYNKQRQDNGRRISNINAYQSLDIFPRECSALDKLVESIDKEIDFCAEQVGLPELALYNVWININPPGGYNTIHNHVGSVLSAVYYVDSKDGQGNIFFERGDGAECFIPSTVKKATYFSSTRATYAPKTNTLLIFPSWLRHGVDANNSTTDRISVAFNYGEKR